MFQFEFPTESTKGIFSQGIYVFQNLRNKTITVSGYEKIKLSIFQWLAVELWLIENDDSHTINPIRTGGRVFSPGSRFFANNFGSNTGTQSKLSDFFFLKFNAK